MQRASFNFVPLYACWIRVRVKQMSLFYRLYTYVLTALCIPKSYLPEYLSVGLGRKSCAKSDWSSFLIEKQETGDARCEMMDIQDIF